MDVETTKTGCLLFANPIFKDSRGSFQEIFKVGTLDVEFKQWNVSYSKPGVVRGMHFQRNNPQGKIVRSLRGCVIDVVLDMRRGSPSFGKTEEFILKENGRSVYIPPGFAHGFWSWNVEDEAIFLYGCTELYDKEGDGGINPLDESFQFPWHSDSKNLIVSDKDKNLPMFKDIESPFVY